MKTTIFFFTICFYLLIPYVSAQTEKSLASVNTEISFDYESSIPTKLSFDIKTDRKKSWLGVSLYPAEFTDALKEGEHTQIELNEETSKKSVKTGKKYVGGSFEVAVWGKKVLKSECTIKDCYWCSKNGFHLDELLYYKAGSLIYSH